MWQALTWTLIGQLFLPLSAWAGGWMQMVLPGGQSMVAEVMLSRAEQTMGLMHRERLPDGQLMLFYYRQPGNRQVWMKNCKFPIDVVWLDAHGKVAAVRTGLPPCTEEPCPIYGPNQPTRHFVEGAAGWVQDHGITIGSQLTLGTIQTTRP